MTEDTTPKPGPRRSTAKTTRDTSAQVAPSPDPSAAAEPDETQGAEPDATVGATDSGTHTAEAPESSPVDVVTVVDAQDRTSASSLAAFTSLSVPLDPAAVPPAPSQPPAGWLSGHPQTTSGPTVSAGPVGLDAAIGSDATVGSAAAPEPTEPLAGGTAEEDGGTGFQPRGSAPSEQRMGDSASDGPAAPAASQRRTRADGPEPAASLTSDRLVAKAAAPPVSGWRRWLYFTTFGYVNLGDSDSVRMQRALEHRIAVRLGERTRYVPVLSRKGGVGKTTVTTLLGMALADLREDRVIAMDANPDRGTLSDRNPGRASHTARQLVKDRFEVNSFAQLSNYTAREGSRLDVLASDADPMVAHAFNDSDYRAVTDILGRYYSIVLTDSGTGMVHSVMEGTLEKADAVVLVSGGSVDEARLASETLSWLEAHGRDDLVRKAIVVINMAAGDGTRVSVDEIEEHFRTRVQHVVRIPHDRHLAEGSQVDFAKLRPATQAAAVELAALVVDELTEE